MNENMKSQIKTKNITYQQYIQNGRFERALYFLKSLPLNLMS